MSVLQEDGRQQGVMSFLQRVTTVCYCKIGTLQVWREQANLQEVSHPMHLARLRLKFVLKVCSQWVP